MVWIQKGHLAGRCPLHRQELGCKAPAWPRPWAAWVLADGWAASLQPGSWLFSCPGGSKDTATLIRLLLCPSNLIRGLLWEEGNTLHLPVCQYGTPSLLATASFRSPLGLIPMCSSNWSLGCSVTYSVMLPCNGNVPPCALSPTPLYNEIDQGPVL